MGNAESTPTSGFDKVGYHVLLVSQGSPSDGILQPFWDVIVGSQGQVFDKDDSRLVQLFQTNVNKPLSLVVYSMKTEKTREVTIVPNNTWGTGGLAGIHIRFGNFDSLLELVWHVLDVYVDSPSSEAQLVSRADYIVGIPEKAFKDPEDFFNYINSHLRQTIQLFVYNSSSENVRIVNITPNNEWGGNGVLGCDIGYGYLHRIPTRVTQNPRTASPSISPSLVPSISPSPSPVSHAHSQPHSHSHSHSHPHHAHSHSPSHSPSISPAPVPPTSSSHSHSASPSPVPTVPSSLFSSSSSIPSAPSSSSSTPSSSSPNILPPARFSPAPLPYNTAYPIPSYSTPFSPLSSFPSPSPIAPYNPDVPFSLSSLPPLPPAFTPTPLPYLQNINNDKNNESPLQKNSIMTPMTDAMEQVKL